MGAVSHPRDPAAVSLIMLVFGENCEGPRELRARTEELMMTNPEVEHSVDQTHQQMNWRNWSSKISRLLLFPGVAI